MNETFRKRDRRTHGSKTGLSGLSAAGQAHGRVPEQSTQGPGTTRGRLRSASRKEICPAGTCGTYDTAGVAGSGNEAEGSAGAYAMLAAKRFQVFPAVHYVQTVVQDDPGVAVAGVQVEYGNGGIPAKACCRSVKRRHPLTSDLPGLSSKVRSQRVAPRRTKPGPR